jgi:hypothetical protein
VNESVTFFKRKNILSEKTDKLKFDLCGLKYLIRIRENNIMKIDD